MASFAPDDHGKVCLDDKEANRPYDGLFKGLGDHSSTVSHSHVRPNPDHNKSTVCLGEEASAERFAFVEQQRHQPPVDPSFYVEQVTTATRHVNKNKSSVQFGDDTTGLSSMTQEQLHDPRAGSPHTKHGKAVNSEHNKSTLVFGDATDQERFEYAEERRGHPVRGKQGQEQLVFAAVAESSSARESCGSGNKRNESTLVLGAGYLSDDAPRRSVAKDFGFMPSAPEMLDEMPRATYVRNPRAVSQYGNFDQSE
ncbi:conserved hypothetical protein [Neospora caninum Liverpool]|uniref:Uncharacterized protein n=1 Tax=Neospora caninum (strain Liverpool) TaxID=572307 RepID=F0VQJ7_NEOCL|nr:conserved hypothetical protein [Neospora caninum Liverpool]CBZ55994.1 conserved hypothetical protein [Neospora caninum Liverpool]CEL70740.1 TPA: hypothetical protein BN1204_064200 [Neospora caninum Liverpool]|eukprot:XP_003886020.1 conserved hypothetical protein [Neospora caninum Liverpool]